MSLLVILEDVSESPESENPESWLLFGEALVEVNFGCFFMFVDKSLVLFVRLSESLLLLHMLDLPMAPGSHTVRTGLRTLGLLILCRGLDLLLIMEASENYTINTKNIFHIRMIKFGKLCL